MLAFEALDLYLGAGPDHLPLAAAAGVLFLEANDITRFYLHKHAFRCRELGSAGVNLLPEFGGNMPRCLSKIFFPRGIQDLSG